MPFPDILGIGLIRQLLDAMDDWAPDGDGSVVVDGEVDRSPTPDGKTGGVVETEEEGLVEQFEVFTPPVFDLEDEARDVRYKRYKNGKTILGKVKRTRYRKRDIAKVQTAVVHQVGAERKASSSRHKFITAQRVTRADGARLKIHPLSCRLVCSNGFDRRPHHAVGIEVVGNFEGEDGSGNWYKPKKFGRGRASIEQLVGLAFELASIRAEVAAAGGRLRLVAPHRVSGRNRDGKPNRPLCPGSRLNQAAEHIAWRLGLEVPDADFRMGGLTIPISWRTRRWLEAHGHNVEALIEAGKWRPAVSMGELAVLDDAIVRATA